MRSGAGASAGRNRQGPPNRSASEDRTRPCPPGTRPCASFRRRSPAGAMGGSEERTGKSALGRLAAQARRDDCRANGDRGRGHGEERITSSACPAGGPARTRAAPARTSRPTGIAGGSGGAAADEPAAQRRRARVRPQPDGRARGAQPTPAEAAQRRSAPCRQRRPPAPAASADPSPRDETALASGRPSGRWRRQPPPAERIIRRSPARQGAERRRARRAGATVTSGPTLVGQAARSQAARRLASRAAERCRRSQGDAQRRTCSSRYALVRSRQRARSKRACCDETDFRHQARWSAAGGNRREALKATDVIETHQSTMPRAWPGNRFHHSPTWNK